MGGNVRKSLIVRERVGYVLLNSMFPLGNVWVFLRGSMGECYRSGT